MIAPATAPRSAGARYSRLTDEQKELAGRWFVAVKRAAYFHVRDRFKCMNEDDFESSVGMAVVVAAAKFRVIPGREPASYRSYFINFALYQVLEQLRQTARHERPRGFRRRDGGPVVLSLSGPLE